MKRAPVKKRNLRRGFTVAEVIIALTVIVIISAAAVVMVAAQIRADAHSTRTVAATNMAENAIECFRYACHTASKNDDIAETFEELYTANNGGIGCGYTRIADGKYEHNGLVTEIEIEGNFISVSVKNAGGEAIVSVKDYRA